MPTRTLPRRPSLHQLKTQANELHRAHRDRDLSAAGRIAAHHPERKGWPPDAVLDQPLALADAQLVVAREYGFRNWAELKERIERARQIERIKPHPGFDAALAALDDGAQRRPRRIVALLSCRRLDRGHGGEGDVVAPGAGDDLHRNRQAGAGTLALARNPLDLSASGAGVHRERSQAVPR